MGCRPTGENTRCSEYRRRRDQQAMGAAKAKSCRKVPTSARLIAEAPAPKYSVTLDAIGRRDRVRFAALAHRRGEAHVTTVAVQLTPALGVRPFRTCPRSGQQDFERRISSL